MSKRLLITIGVIMLLTAGTLTAVKFAKGYRLDLRKKKVTSTGLLVANSFPKGAQVFIDGKLTTATDDTLNLPPADYQIKIIKDGYIGWEKTISLEKELVFQTNVNLWPAVPDLKSLTFSGAINPTPSADLNMIAYSVASASAQSKNGLWVLDLANSSAFSFSQSPRQICQNSKTLDFNQAELYWAPNNKEILVKTKDDTLLLDAAKMNDIKDLKDVTARLSLIIDEWEEEIKLQKNRQWEKLPLEMQKIASDSAKNVYFSPDGEKIIYTATTKTTIPKNLISPLPASNNQKETRDLEPDKIYIYDLKEDKNFYIDQAEKEAEEITVEEKGKKIDKNAELENRLKQLKKQSLALYSQKYQWLPTSRHLVLTEADKIIILEYDNTNRATIYAGPFINNFVIPSPYADRLIVLASLNPDSQVSANLYAIELK